MDHPLTLEEVISFLLQTPLFEDLDPSELAEIVHIMQIQRLRDGQVIFREDDPGDSWYVIFQGTAVVTKNLTEGGSRVIALLESRAIFGEMAVLDGSSRSANVTARGEGVVFRVRRDEFEDLLETGSLAAYKLVLAMARVLCQRQRNFTAQLSTVRGAQDPGPEDSLTRKMAELVDAYTVSE
jgi:CRP/FNR family cyclic AMP-dependent transcriptional regulator